MSFIETTRFLAACQAAGYDFDAAALVAAGLSAIHFGRDRRREAVARLLPRVDLAGWDPNWVDTPAADLPRAWRRAEWSSLPPEEQARRRAWGLLRRAEQQAAAAEAEVRGLTDATPEQAAGMVAAARGLLEQATDAATGAGDEYLVDRLGDLAADVVVLEALARVAVETADAATAAQRVAVEPRIACSICSATSPSVPTANRPGWLR